MSALQRIQQTIAPELQRLNSLIASTLNSPNELMNRVIQTYLRSKGKQIRPVLVILSAKLMGRVDDNVISAAASVELLHNASLIHDDVVDETKMRRDMPTINGLWDNHIAVLVGDFFVSSSLQRALDTADLRIIDCVARLGKLLSVGEIDQIYNARYHCLSEEAYFTAIGRKTASLFVSCAEMGGYAAGCNEAELKPLLEFAEALGLCFQIKDDIFDYFEDATVGKPTGNDLREGKITLPLLHVLLREAGTTEGDAMTALSRQEFLDSTQIDTLIDYARKNGGIEYACRTMQRLRDRAVTTLRNAYPHSQTVDDLVDLIDFTICRNF